ncbi:MAG TPA: FxLYD domain-containing protein [Bryobacteraceae bacterium]|nr:FxLYD domain-containing protein [Bryobacteraceae bacterium]
MKTLRKLWESIVYAGMRPDSAPSAPRSGRRLGRFRDKVERFLSGGPAPSDPLYLTNRSIFQRARVAILVLIPCLILLGLLALGVSHRLRVREKPVHQPTPAEIAQATLPNLVKNIQITTDHDLEVAEARIQHGDPTMVVGTVKNNTAHAIDNARVVFTLTTEVGAKLGYVAVHIEHVDPKSTAPFSLGIEQENAAFALVREIVLQ